MNLSASPAEKPWAERTQADKVRAVAELERLRLPEAEEPEALIYGYVHCRAAEKLAERLRGTRLAVYVLSQTRLLVLERR